MAQAGDTITYTYSDGSSVVEDVSSVAAALVEYCDGAGGSDGDGSGGRVENALIDVSGQNNLYIWVGGSTGFGRYDGSENFSGVSGGGSTEISFSNTDSSQSSDEPFLVASGGGGAFTTDTFASLPSGARGNNTLATAPPLGGEGGETPSDGEGSIDDQNRGHVSGGTTITGGGSSGTVNGEVKISYLNPPSPPSNLQLTVQ